jgi:hypothetical protein
MDCKTARLLLDYARPQPAELAGADAAALEGHLAHCADCDALARGERQLADALGRAIRAVPVPDGLHDRLLRRLAVERRRWFRRRLAPVAAVAAVFLVLVTWLAWRRPPLPAPDPDGAVEGISLRDNARRSPEKVEEWFHANHPDRPMLAPREFEQRPLNYGLLTSIGLADFQGQRVPLLLFGDAQKQARVYVLSTRNFNLDELKQQPTKDSKGYTFAARPCPEDPDHIVYVFIYSGNTMDPFLIGPPPPVG